MIELRGVTKHYHTHAGEFVALRDVSLTISQGEFVVVLGRSGSGKSTLINMITGIDRPTRGEVTIGSHAVHMLGENEMARWRGKTIGIVFQFFQLLPTLTVLQNILLPMDFCGLYSHEREERGMMLLEMVGLAGHEHKLPTAISGGQQQRVAIARALANDPPVIVADEPTGNLDSHTAEHVFELFAKLVKSGKTIVMVTHDQDLARRAHQTVHLVDGQVVGAHSEAFAAAS